jgi:ketol-acid reductoisomerase
MSLEQAIETLTKAVQELTAVTKAGGGKNTTQSSSETSSKTETKKKETPKSEHSRTDMQAALNEVKEKKGMPAAKQILADHGDGKKMAEVADDKIDAVYKAAKAALEAEDDDM